MACRRFSRGFTLVEVLVAMGLMAMAVLAIAPLFVGSLKSNGAGQDLSQLNALAKQQLEELLQYNFTDARLAVATGKTVSIINQDGTTTTTSGQLYRNEIPTTQTDGSTTISFPYRLYYMVQDFPITSIVNGAVPTPSTAVDDSSSNYVKMITVFVASSREGLQATGYGKNFQAGILPASLGGKQIRMSAIKTQ